MKHYKIDENFYAYDCPGTHAMVGVQNNNVPRNACYALLERAGCLIHNELSQLPDSEKADLRAAPCHLSLESSCAPKGMSLL